MMESDLDGRRSVSVVILHFDNGNNVSLERQSPFGDLGQLISSLHLSLRPPGVQRGEIVEHVEAAKRKYSVQYSPTRYPLVQV